MKITKYILAGTLLAFGCSACDLIGSIDEIKQENVLTDETLITDAASAQAAVYGIYSIWHEFNVHVNSSNLNLVSKAVLFNGFVGSTGFQTGDMKDDNLSLEHAYTSYYRIINMANSVLAQLEGRKISGLSDTESARLIGEARFERALAHFFLLRVFGEFYDMKSQYGIVVMDKTVRDGHVSSRSTVAQSYEFILKDLIYAETNCSHAPAFHYYATATTAKALHAKVLLYMGRYAEAGQLAAAVIAEGGFYSFDDNFMDTFAAGYNAKEALLSIYTSYPNEIIQTAWWSTFTPGSGLVGLAKELAAGLPEGTENSEYDPRFVLLYPAYAASGFGAGCGKYPMDDFGATAKSNTIFLLRMTEMYYIQAECELRATGGNVGTARTLLKKLVARAGYADTYIDKIADGDLLAELRRQKYMDLHAECNEEWYDMARYHHAGNIDIFKSGLTPLKHLCLPIPRAALAGNKLLVQNPDYITQQ